MAQKTFKDFGRLARSARSLEHKNDLCWELKRRLEAVKRAGVVVAGEADMHDKLQGRFEEGLKILENLEQAGDATRANALLNDLEQVLSDEDWEVAEQILAELTKKEEEQQKNIQECEYKIAEWTAYTEKWLEGLAQAKEARAPVIQEKRELLKLKALVDLAEKSLRKQKFGLIAEPLSQLEAAKDKPQQLLEKILGKVKNHSTFCPTGRSALAAITQS